jgi:hypothetical protein
VRAGNPHATSTRAAALPEFGSGLRAHLARHGHTIDTREPRPSERYLTPQGVSEARRRSKRAVIVLRRPSDGARVTLEPQPVTDWTMPGYRVGSDPATALASVRKGEAELNDPYFGGACVVVHNHARPGGFTG